MRSLLGLLFLVFLPPILHAGANRFIHLDTADPYYPSRTFPRLLTPQWVGEPGVEAVVILAIDDMRGSEAWERYLRPILARLEKIDGRAPASIMTCKIDPDDPQLQTWLKRGVSLETHTIDHPCPLLGKGGLEPARSTFNRCIDLLATVPGNKPVAFRTPCCDSMNTPGPRMFREVFGRTTGKGNFLHLDSSVFNLTTPDDPEVPRDLVFSRTGQDRFRHYFSFGRPFGNYICDYPYPYVIDRLCWQFPCATPSDWQGQNRFGNASPITLADMKASLDAAVIKKGVWPLVFHPYGWVSNTQVVDLIDHAVMKHGRKVKFLSFREAHERLVKNLLAGHPLRGKDGGDNGVRLLDIDGDGFMDVVIANADLQQTRLWDAKKQTWHTTTFPVRLGPGVRFGVLRAGGKASVLLRDGRAEGLWHFDGSRWVSEKNGLAGLALGGQPVHTSRDGADQGVRLVDVDGDGICELLVANPTQRGVFRWSQKERKWQKLPLSIPAGVSFVDVRGQDAGLRLVDVDDDGCLDLISSNDEGYSLHLFTKDSGWTRKVMAGKRGESGGLPPFVSKGSEMGAWFLDRHLWVQNENTAVLPGVVERRSFNDLLTGVDQPALSPQAGLHSVKPRPGFTVEQMAAEPLVMSPIAFAWGQDGKFWVVEMGDYPLGVDGKGKPGGRVVYLEDTDGDGRYDKRTVFLDNLPFPTGVLPWRKGVLVTCAPDIFYAEDTDGDGKADKREVLYTGFREGNQQHRVNSLVWGLDGWIYVANGDSGGRIQSIKTGKTVDISGRDLRIRPDTGDLDAQTGQTQYGRNRDDAGNWFGGNNSLPMWHYVLADHYVRRNPYFAPQEVRVQVPAVPGAAPVFPVSRTLPRFNDPGAAGRFTSACSPIVYRDELFGPHFSHSLFVSEPVHNLVHRERLTPTGVTFRGTRAEDEQNSEFLASTDPWFRPTMIQTGPDGALWVADMYRAVIEHPEWIPPQIQKRIDLRAGHDRGRIYRVFPVGAKPRDIPRLGRLDLAGLAGALDSPSGWQRDLAHMMLLWRADGKAVAHVEKLLGTKRALTRLQALCVLDGLGALKVPHLAAGLDDADPAVRRNAVRLCEGRLPGDEALVAALGRRVRDEDAGVRLQLACTLGEWKDARAGKLLGDMLRRDTSDRFIHAAAMSSLSPANLDAVLATVLEGPPATDLAAALLRQASAMGQESATTTLLQRLAKVPAGEQPGWRLDVLGAFLDGLSARGSTLAAVNKTASKPLQQAIAGLAPLFETARSGAADEKQPLTERLRYVRLLGRGTDQVEKDRALLSSLLTPTVEGELQLAAVQALARESDPATAKVLLAGWRAHGPSLRSLILQVLLERPAWLPALLDAIEKKAVPPSEIDLPRRQQLLGHRSEAIRKRAAKVFAGSIAADRQKVIDSYRTVLTRQGDPGRGKAVFLKTCANCHRLGGEGNEAGPDLASLSGKSAEYLLVAILDPNRAVEARYLAYQADLADGRVLTGILASETGASVTLVTAEGKQVVVLRKNLERLASTGKSLMPEGMEKDVSPANMADLLAYLRSQMPAAKPKSFPGNKPEVVRAGKDGVLRLTALNAEIHGPFLVLETQYNNLGFWANVADRAVWSLEVPRAGQYEVWIDHAMDDGNAGNTFVLEADEVLLTAKVASTGSWDTYRDVRFGSVRLPAGAVRLTMRSQGRLRGALIDLRKIRLVPVK